MLAPGGGIRRGNGVTRAHRLASLPSHRMCRSDQTPAESIFIVHLSDVRQIAQVRFLKRIVTVSINLLNTISKYF